MNDDRAPSARPTGRPWFEVVAATITVAVVAVLAFAVFRHLTEPGRPVLPESWCRAGASGRLPPLLSSAIFTQWHLDGIALVVIGVLASLYVGGARSARRQAIAWSGHNTASFMAGLAVCALATNSSIAVYDMALFSAHMVGHLMLVMVAPVLLCAGRPLHLLLAACGEPWRTRLTRLLSGRICSLLFCPPVALACYAGVIVGSHLTGIMNSVMQHPWAGQLEHLVYVVVGCQFFTLIVTDDPPIRWRLTTPARWILLALSMAVDTFTGLVLIMSVRPISMQTVPGLEVNPLTDTHTGGAIMWVGGDGLMALVMIALVVAWLRSPAQRDRDRGAWFEQARLTTFTAHTGVEMAAGPAARIDFDDEDARREEYNKWLAEIDTGRGR